MPKPPQSPKSSKLSQSLTPSKSPQPVKHSRLLQSHHYQALIASVQNILSTGLIAAQKALEYHRLETYWLIGQDIRQRIEGSNGELVLDEELYSEISKSLKKNMALDFTTDTLRRIIQFSKNYPDFPENTTLGFTDYVALMRVKDIKERRRLEKLAIKNNLTIGQIKALIQQLKLESSPDPDQEPVEKHTLAFVRGEPYVYHVFPDEYLQGERFFRIDCGFKMDEDFPKGNPFQPRKTRIVYSTKNADGTYRIHEYKKANALDMLYTYAANVYRVIDGDTLDARIDAGFGRRLTDRIRLKGINCAELSQEKGEEARAFVTEFLKPCPIVVMRTQKNKEKEMYGRWLADVFALPGCSDPFKIAAEGVYLNQLLLDEGLAEIYK